MMLRPLLDKVELAAARERQCERCGGTTVVRSYGGLYACPACQPRDPAGGLMDLLRTMGIAWVVLAAAFFIVVMT